MDILRFVPPEIAELILRNLSTKELSACSLVSKKWRNISSSDRLWKPHCGDLNLLDYLPSGDGSGTCFRQIYAEFVLSWKTGSYTPYSLPREQGALDSFIEVEEDLLVIHGLNQAFQLYRLHPCGPRLIGHIDSAPYSCFCLRAFNDSYIVVQADRGIKVYEATRSSCCFHSAYLWRDGNLIVYTKSQESEFNGNLSQDVKYTHLDGTYFYFQFSKGHRIHAVNLETLCHTSTEELANFRLLGHAKPSNGYVYLFNEVTKVIRVLDRTLSEEIMALHTDPTIFSVPALRTSDSYIVGLFDCQGDKQLIRVWDKFHGNEVLSKRFQEREIDVQDVLISRDLLFILGLKFSSMVSNVDHCVLSCFSITSGTNLWEQHLPQWNTLFPINEPPWGSNGNLYFIKPQFLAVELEDGDRRCIFVFDSVSGKKLNDFTEIRWSNGAAPCLSSKCFVTETEEEFQICSFIPNKFQQESGELVGGEEDF